MKSIAILVVCFSLAYSVPVKQNVDQKDLIDFALNALGVGQIVETVQQLGTQYWNQLVQIATQLLFAGQQICAQAQAVFTQLVSDLQNHAGDALPLVQQAIASLTALLGSSGKRDLIDFALNALGVGQIVETVQQLGTQYWNQLVQIATQLLFAGQQIWAQAQAVFTQLVSDLQNHAGDALPLVQQAIASLTALLGSSGKRDLIDFALNALGVGQIVETVQQLGTQYWNQLVQIATQLLFAGQQICAQAQAVFTQLVSDLQNHAGDALPLVQQAIASLTALLGSSGKRDLIDFALNALGVGQIVETVQQLGTQYWNQLVQIATQLLFAGQQIWAQAQAVFTQLVSDLQNHAGDALPLVQQAIASLTALLQG